MTRAVATGPAMTERELQRWVIDQARSLGWGVTLSARRSMLAEAEAYKIEPPPLDGLVFHPQYSLGSEPGWPDLTLIRRRDRRLIFAELKAEKGVVSVRQAEVLELLGCLTDGEGWDELDVLATSIADDPFPGTTTAIEVAMHKLPRIEVHVWRPSDVERIVELLR